MEAKDLLGRAISHAGSKYKLAKALGLSQTMIGKMERGEKAVPLETVADLAAYLELDVGQNVTEALIEQTRGTARGERIARAVGKTLRAVRGATAAILVGVVATALTAGSAMVPNSFADRVRRRR